jgi:hypothetical protein
VSDERYTRLQVREGIQDLLERESQDLDQSVERIDLLTALLAVTKQQRNALIMIASGYSLRDVSRHLIAGKVNPNKGRRLVLAAEEAVLEQLNQEPFNKGS